MEKERAGAAECGGSFSLFGWWEFDAYFPAAFDVYITVWKTRWKMCKTQKRRSISGVTNGL